MGKAVNPRPSGWRRRGWWQGGGQAARRGGRPAIEALEPRQLLANGARLFDFGAPTSATEPGATLVAATPYSPGAGYGWTAAGYLPGAFDRGKGTPPAGAFNFGVDGTFAVDLPNGTYAVTAQFGDVRGF